MFNFKLRRLTRLIYNQVKHLPWRTVSAPEHYSKPEISSPPVTLDGKTYDIQIKRDGPTMNVTLRVDDRPVYPGGEYVRWWPWAWERTVFNRVVQNDYKLKIIPDDNVQEALIVALEPLPSEGQLSLVDQKKGLPSSNPE